MSKKSEDQIRELFKSMHAKGASTNNVANAWRSNTAYEFNGNTFVNEFDAMLEENLNIAESVYKKFGA